LGFLLYLGLCFGRCFCLGDGNFQGRRWLAHSNEKCERCESNTAAPGESGTAQQRTDRKFLRARRSELLTRSVRFGFERGTHVHLQLRRRWCNANGARFVAQRLEKRPFARAIGAFCQVRRNF
jgi:hypothetical protein